MNSKQQNKVGKVLHYKIDVQSLEKFRKTIKNHTIKPRSLSIRFLEVNYLPEPKRMQTLGYLNKILTKIRPIQKLDLTKAFKAKYTNEEKFMQLAKYQRSVKKLHLPLDRHFEHQTPYISSFLKCFKGLRNIEWKTEYPRWRYRLEMSQIITRSIFAVGLKRQKPTSLGFWYESPGSDNVISLQRLPTSLHKLRLFFENVKGDKSLLSFPQLKQLKTLLLTLPKNKEGCKIILDSIRNLGALEFLRLYFKEDLSEVQAPENWLQGLHTLKHLKVSFGSLPQGLDNFLRGVSQANLDNLETFSLDLKDKQAQESILGPILACLDNFPNVKNLTLKIYYDWEQETGIDFLKVLTKKISKLSLKKLKLCLTHPLPDDRRLKKPPPIFISIHELLKGSKDMKEVSFISNHAHVETFSDIMHECQRFAPSLHKLQIDTGSFTPNKKFLQEVCDFIQTLKNVKVLKLSNFNMDRDISIGKLFQSVLTLKDLKKLTIGRFEKAVTPKGFNKHIGALLSKPGFEILKKYNSYYLFYTTDKDADNFQTILERAAKVNPSLDYDSYAFYVTSNARKKSMNQRWSDHFY